MLQPLGYLACLAGIGPVLALALFFTAIEKVASVNGWPGLGKLFLHCLEFIGTPWKLLAVLVAALALFLGGFFNSTRGWACLVVGLLGLAGLVQVIVVARPTAPGEFVFLVPSVVATITAFVWAWQILKSDLLG